METFSPHTHEQGSEAPEEHILTSDELRLRNSIQRELMKRYIASSGLDRETASVQWIDKNSKTFAEVLAMRPDLSLVFESDPETALNEFERILG